MLRRSLILSLAVLALAPAGAEAGLVTTASAHRQLSVAAASPRYASWLASSPMPQPGGEVEVIEAPCDALPVAACAYPDGRLFIDPASSRAVFLHEVGHLFDYRVLTDADRAAFQQAIGISGPWSLGPEGWQDHATQPSELFAEAYSVCARARSVRGHWRAPRAGRFGTEALMLGFGPRRHAALCEQIASFA